MTMDTAQASGRRAGRLSSYALGSLAARFVFSNAFRLKVVNPERIPARGPLVVVANHESFLDGPLLTAVLPDRQLTFFSAAYLFERPFTGWALRRVGALPVEAQGRNLDSLREAIAILREAGTLAVFPGGGIDRDEVLGGAAFVALKAEAPVLPLRIMGTREALPPGEKLPYLTPITVQVGAPLQPAELAEGCANTRSAVAAGTRALASVLAEPRPVWRDVCRQRFD